MFSHRSPEAKVEAVLVKSSRRLARELNEQGCSYTIPRGGYDRLVVAGGYGGLLLARYGTDTLERPYAEQIWLLSVEPDHVVAGAIYGWMRTNQEDPQELRFEGAAMLDREMPAEFIYDLPGYVRRVKLGLTAPVAESLVYEPSRLAAPTLTSINKQIHPIPQIAS